jgi:uncharacterized membrane protein YedE/YeeE
MHLDVIAPLAGGALIGLSATLLLAFNGRIAGISGILGGIVHSPAPGERGWRVAFLVGLLAGGVAMLLARPASFGSTPAPLPLVVVAGLLVGFGTRLGGGCTSGHGVCGISRFSARSVTATITFVITGVLATFVVRHVLGAAR